MMQAVHLPLARCGRGWRPFVALLLAFTSTFTGAHAAPPIAHWTHAGGARIHLVALPALPMLDVQIDLDAGSRRDPAQQAGLAQATALMLGKGVAAQGALAALDENELVEAWADLGAQFTAQAGADRFSIRLRSLSRDDVLWPAIDLAARQLAQPAFAAPVWSRERDRLVAHWRQVQTEPDTKARQLFEQAVYAAHPYGQQPRPETWSAIGVGDMQAFYRRHARACDARVTLVGDITRTQAEALVERLLSGWTPHGCAALSTVAEVPSLAAAQTLRRAFPVAQAQIMIGQPGFARNDPAFFALVVGNHILGGGGFTSRLMQQVREQRGLTYGIHSQFSPGRHAGAFVVSTQTRPDRAQEAVDLIQAEIRRFVQEGPTEEELEQAKTSLINGFALRIDSNRKLLDNVAAMAWNDLPMNHLDTWTSQVAAVSRGQVQQAFARILQPERMVTVVLGGPGP